MLYFFYKMQEHPDIQKQIQAELDAVVGRERLPSFNDQPDLPYIGALRKELLRYEPPAPAGTSPPSHCITSPSNRSSRPSTRVNRG